MLFIETYYVLYKLWPKLDRSKNLLALIDSYDQLILLDILFFILLFVEVMLYVIIVNYFETEDFLEKFSFEYELISD